MNSTTELELLYHSFLSSWMKQNKKWSYCVITNYKWNNSTLTMREDGVIPVIRVQIAEFHVVRTPTKTVTANHVWLDPVFYGHLLKKQPFAVTVFVGVRTTWNSAIWTRITGITPSSRIVSVLLFHRKFNGRQHHLVNRYGIYDHRYVPFVTIRILVFLHAWLITGFITMVTLLVHLAE
jgi:hypothetical protein